MELFCQLRDKLGVFGFFDDVDFLQRIGLFVVEFQHAFVGLWTAPFDEAEAVGAHGPAEADAHFGKRLVVGRERGIFPRQIGFAKQRDEAAAGEHGGRGQAAELGKRRIHIDELDQGVGAFTDMLLAGYADHEGHARRPPSWCACSRCRARRAGSRDRPRE